MKLKPSKEIWNWYKGCITTDLIASLISDVLAGYHISYSGTELLKDLKLYTKNGRINKNGRLALAHHCHNKYHHNKEGIELVIPDNSNYEV